MRWKTDQVLDVSIPSLPVIVGTPILIKNQRKFSAQLQNTLPHPLRIQLSHPPFQKPRIRGPNQLPLLQPNILPRPLQMIYYIPILLLLI